MRTSTAQTASYYNQVIEILAQLGKTADNPRPLALPETRYRQLYQQQRITRHDIATAFGQHPHLQPEQTVCALSARKISRQDIYQAALLFDLSAPSTNQLAWLRDEMATFKRIQPDVPATPRQQLLAGGDEASAIQALWDALLDKLECTPLEEDVQPDDVNIGPVHAVLRQLASTELARLLAGLGDLHSLKDFVRALSGVDILDAVHQHLQQVCAAVLAANGAWTTPAHQQQGLYGLWRTLARQDASLFLHQLPDWQNIIADLPDDAVTAIVQQLQCLELAPAQWPAYLRRLSQELPDWPQPLRPLGEMPAHTDMLAIRLTLDRLWLNQVCHDVWKIEAKVGSLHNYFQKNQSEFWVRLQLYQGQLPEYLNQQAQALIIRSGSERQCRTDWQQLADALVLRQRRLARVPDQETGSWQLFRLCQHLGLNADVLQTLEKTDLLALLSVVDGFNWDEREKIWRCADQHHYWQALRAALPSQQGLPDLHIIHQEDCLVTRPLVVPQPSSGLKQLCQPTQCYGQPLLAYLSLYLCAPILLAKVLANILLPASFPQSALTGANTDHDIHSLAQFLQQAGLAQHGADFVILVASECLDGQYGQNRRQDFKSLAKRLNQPDIRMQLTRHGIFIPANTWFLAVDYDTMPIL
ncbi:MAG: Na-translocating system protein MpsB [Methylovulum sp.]|nr:Na-translocating system protein MpsB [Methylovulum sp.]